jgi:hypothetical protein
MVGPRWFDKDEHLLIMYSHAQWGIYQSPPPPPQVPYCPNTPLKSREKDQKNEEHDEENSEERVKIYLREELKGAHAYF